MSEAPGLLGDPRRPEPGRRRRPIRPTALERRARRELVASASAPGVRDTRRAENRGRRAHVAELRCECALPGCRDLVPASAVAHRGAAEHFIVVPEHAAGNGRVVRAADTFFVVEPNRRQAGSRPIAPTDVGRLVAPVAP